MTPAAMRREMMSIAHSSHIRIKEMYSLSTEYNVLASHEQKSKEMHFQMYYLSFPPVITGQRTDLTT